MIDGDTIQVTTGSKQYTVRLIGADTPEMKHPTKPVQRFGQEASAFTTATLDTATGGCCGTSTWTARTSTPG